MEKGFEVGTPRTFRTRNWALGSGVSGLCTGGTRVYGECNEEEWLECRAG